MSDVSEIYVRLLQSDSTPSVVNLCSGRSVSLLRIIERMNSISGMEMQVRVNPDFVRANEIKSDTIPCEVALLNHALIRLKGGVINNFFLQKEAALQQLDSAEWLGKYSSDRKL